MVGRRHKKAVRVFRRGCKYLIKKKMMTVAVEEAPANFVPAAAVIRRSRALFGITGLKAYVGWYIGIL